MLCTASLASVYWRWSKKCVIGDDGGDGVGVLKRIKLSDYLSPLEQKKKKIDSRDWTRDLRWMRSSLSISPVRNWRSTPVRNGWNKLPCVVRVLRGLWTSAHNQACCNYKAYWPLYWGECICWCWAKLSDCLKLPLQPGIVHLYCLLVGLEIRRISWGSM